MPKLDHIFISPWNANKAKHSKGIEVKILANSQILTEAICIENERCQIPGSKSIMSHWISVKAAVEFLIYANRMCQLIVEVRSICVVRSMFLSVYILLFKQMLIGFVFISRNRNLITVLFAAVVYPTQFSNSMANFASNLHILWFTYLAQFIEIFDYNLCYKNRINLFS